MVKNPRFPHTCRIYRQRTDPFSGEVLNEETVYEGKCRKSLNRAGAYGGVPVTATYRLGVGVPHLAVMAGDMIDVTDDTGSYHGALVVEPQPGNLGTTIYFNLTKN